MEKRIPCLDLKDNISKLKKKYLLLSREYMIRLLFREVPLWRNLKKNSPVFAERHMQ